MVCWTMAKTKTNIKQTHLSPVTCNVEMKKLSMESNSNMEITVITQRLHWKYYLGIISERKDLCLTQLWRTEISSSLQLTKSLSEDKKLFRTMFFGGRRAGCEVVPLQYGLKQIHENMIKKEEHDKEEMEKWKPLYSSSNPHQVPYRSHFLYP